MEQKKNYGVLDIIGLTFGIISMFISLGLAVYILISSGVFDPDGMLGMVIVLALIFLILLMAIPLTFFAIGVLEIVKFNSKIKNKQNKIHFKFQCVLFSIGTVVSLLIYGWIMLLTIVPCLICVIVGFINARDLKNVREFNTDQTLDNLQSKQEMKSQINFCAHCGTKIIEGSRFCAKCGKEINK